MAHNPSRRDTLMVIAALTACGALAGPSRAETLARLAAAAGNAGILFGTSIAQDALDDPALGELYRRHAGILTADWALKFSALRPDADTFDYSWADPLLAFAEAAGLPFRGHTLAWNDMRPDWLTAMSPAEQRRALDHHTEVVAGRYAGRLHSWDVVNEPFWPGHGVPGGWRDGPWLAAFGTDYVEHMFRRARAADPTAKLVLNEAHTEQWTDTGAAIRSGLMQLIDRLLDAGAPLDAVGLQGHLQPQWAMDVNGFADFVAAIGERGLPVYITELDVNDVAFPDDIGERDAAVAATYRDVLGPVLALPAVTMVVTWQLADRASHYAGMAREAGLRAPRPLPFDDALAPKPAYRALIDAFRAAPRR